MLQKVCQSTDGARMMQIREVLPRRTHVRLEYFQRASGIKTTHPNYDVNI